MMRPILSHVAVAAFLAAAPAAVKADVTIRYTFEVSSPLLPGANNSHAMVIYMKGNKGATVVDTQTTIVDFARRQVTIIDTARKKYATIAASEYGDKMKTQIIDMMPGASGMPGVADILKTMKTTCDTKNSDTAEAIQGVMGLKREVTCMMTMEMPESMKRPMPSMVMKMVMRIWSAVPGERVRVPGLWQLSGYELWQNYFMNPVESLGKMLPQGIMPMIEATQKDQSATLRSSTEISLNMPMPGMPAGDTPLMTIREEMTGLSTELLDDSVFNVPADCIEEPFEAVMRGITEAAVAGALKDRPKMGQGTPGSTGQTPAK